MPYLFLILLFCAIAPFVGIYVCIVMPIQGAVEDAVRIKNKDTTYLNDPTTWTVGLSIGPWLIFSMLLVVAPVELFHLDPDSTIAGWVAGVGMLLAMIPAWLFTRTVVRYFIRRKIPGVHFYKNSVVPI